MKPSRRDRRFWAIAREEVSCAGYWKFSPITLGPWINGIVLFLLALLVPFYVGWQYAQIAWRSLRRPSD